MVSTHVEKFSNFDNIIHAELQTPPSVIDIQLAHFGFIRSTNPER